jgi:hypothetical protein
MRHWKVFGLVLLQATCAGSNTPTTPPGGKADSGGVSICPDHPDQCGGTCCGIHCIDTMSDIHNCGACGTGCDTGQLCSGGVCGCPPSGTKCGTAQTCCGTSGCKSLMDDAFNCGACGKQCTSGQMCTNGTCACPAAGCNVTPDMAMPPQPDMAMQSGGNCVCSIGLCDSDPFFPGLCVGQDCCYADLLFGTCANTNCNPN